MRTFIILSAIFISFVFGSAQLSSSRKYHLFNPTPKDKMRAMHTDRPDVTETPFTVDAGRFQFEFDFLNVYRHPISAKRRETDLLFINSIAKVGLLDFWDFEVVFSANQWHFPDNRNNPADTLKSRSGLGDIGFRSKFNLFGNQHEQYGVALMPSFLLPLNNATSEQVFIPGLVAIWAYNFAERWELGGQFEFFRLYDLDKKLMFNEFWSTFEIGYGFNERWSMFTEYVAIISENRSFLNTWNAGVVYAFTDNFRLDLAFNLGLNKRSPSTVFSGFSFRF